MREGHWHASLPTGTDGSADTRNPKNHRVSLSGSLSPLYRELYPDVPPVQLKHLPSCAAGLRVFVYNLTINATRTFSLSDERARATTTADVLRDLERQRGRANCDWARSPCLETQHSLTGGNWDYSNQRQYAAELPLLAKFMLMPRQTTVAAEADIFVVPWLGSAELTWFHRQWSPSSPFVNSRFRSTLRQLQHYAGRERRHIFLSSRDLTYVPLEPKRETLRSGAMLLHYGPRRPGSRGDVVVAPNSAGFGSRLERLEHPAPTFIFSMMDEKLNPQNMSVGAALRILNASRNDIRYFPIGDHRSLSLPPLVAFSMMQQSLLCPIVQGDLPFQHRLFDTLAAGCVPLLFASKLIVEGDAKSRHMGGASKECEAWSWEQPASKPAKDGFCVEHTLPFHRTVPWREITVRLDSGLLREPIALAAVIASLDRAELARKRLRLEAVRRRFMYDWSGESADAFSSTLEEICALLQGAEGNQTEQRFP